jgi:hypothetical protein
LLSNLSGNVSKWDERMQWGFFFDLNFRVWFTQHTTHFWKN